MLTQKPRGTADLLPGEVEQWQRLEQQFRDVCRAYHYEEVRTPMFEHTELFLRGVGETTDIVEKEVYTFKDRGDRSITLRPEGTAGVVRAYVENKLYGQPGLTKLYYVGPMFRYEKPQKGRWRQFHQYGVEVLGADTPEIDAEVIALGMTFLTRLGIRDLSLELNSVGCAVCRPKHKEEMIERLLPVKDELCRDCQNRLEKNPLRIFDCKNDRCQALLVQVGAPTVFERLCDDCRTHFDQVTANLEQMGIAYVVNQKLVRGLDYYTRTAWEFTVPGYSTVLGGGRYNSLVSQVGGPETPGIGFAGGIERALLVLHEQGVEPPTAGAVDVFVAIADEAAKMPAAKLLQTLRSAGVSADRDYEGRGMKAQFKMADRYGAKFVAVLGEQELTEGVVTVKDLGTGQQSSVEASQVVQYFQEKVSVS